MAATASPYGFVPVKKADGTPFTQAQESFPIKAEAKNIGYGAIVSLAAGEVKLATGDGTNAVAQNFGGSSVGAVGIFVGCEYINAQGQLIFSQYYPASTAGATAYVVTDPGVTFQVQSNTAVTAAKLGQNVNITGAQVTGDTNTTTGKTDIAVGAPVKTLLPFKIVGFSDRPGSAAGDDKTDLLVKFNLAYHNYGTAFTAI